MNDKDESRQAVDRDAAETERSQPNWFDRLRSRVGLKSANLRDNLEVALDEDEHTGEHFSPGERAMLRNILQLRELRVDDVMVPRADIDAVETILPIRDVLAAFRESGHSRMPVYEETLDNPLGMVHIKDLMVYLTRSVFDKSVANGDTVDGAPPDAKSFTPDPIDLDRPLKSVNVMRPLLFVPPSMPATELLANMQTNRIQMALVIDEYGGTDGLVSLEDIVETVVGDIEDEHDDIEGPLITPAGDGAYMADARADLNEVAAVLGGAFNADDYAEEVDTLGGLIFSLLERIPVRGELIDQFPGFEFEIVDADPRRIKRLRIYHSGTRSRVVDPRRTSQRQNALPTDSEPAAATAPRATADDQKRVRAPDRGDPAQLRPVSGETADSGGENARKDTSASDAA